MAADAVVSTAIETVGKLVIEEVQKLAGVSDEVDELQRQLQYLQSFLNDAQSKKNNNRDIQVWITQSKKLAYEVEDLLEEYVLKISSQRDNSFFERIRFCFVNECFVRHSIASKIQTLNSRILSLGTSLKEYGIRETLNGKEDVGSSSQQQQQFRRTYSHAANDDFVKLDDDIEMLVNHLVKESSGDDLHQVISISGMGGLGKTTLARKVYNHSEIQGYFEKLAWVSISQQWQTRDILQGILIKFYQDKRDQIEKWRDEEIMRKLSETFGNNKCMVVLDDIWSSDVWDCIKDAFPMRKNESKILLSTRNKDVALDIGGPNGFNHEPRFLTDIESWELLQLNAFGKLHQNVDEHMSEMEKLGKEMVKYCGGLPLAVVVLGGVLAKKKNIEDWKVVQKNVKAHIARGKEGVLKKILELSYNDLPLKLKPCFLYLGMYPEDSEIKVERLYQLWISEGMIFEKDKKSNESMMEVAECYLEELAERSLVQVEVDKLMGGLLRFKWCRLHDHIRDLSVDKGNEENFFSCVDLRNDFDDQVDKSSFPTNQIYRLNVHFENIKDFSKYLPPLKRNTRYTRSLRLVVEERGPTTEAICTQINQFPKLRSLEIKGLHLEKGNVSSKCCIRALDHHLEGIVNLIHLRYLSLEGCLYSSLPLSFRNLKQLQTLDLQFLYGTCIPNIICEMTLLKHLYLPQDFTIFEGEEIRFDGLNKLEILDKFDSETCCFEDLVKLTNLRWLQATLYIKREKEVHTLMFLLDLQSLVTINMQIMIHEEVCSIEQRCKVFSKLFSCGKVEKLWISKSIGGLPKYEIGLGSHLVELSLISSDLEEDPMKMLEKLSNLRELTLSNCFLGSKMNCTRGSFLQLRKLWVQFLPNLKEWIIVEGAMPNLLYLSIHSCLELETIPDGLIFIKTLKSLKIRFMPDEFCRKIQEINDEEGEDFYKVKHVRSIKFYSETQRVR